MTRARLNEADLQERLAKALAIEDQTERRRAANAVRQSIAQLQYRSTLGSGERKRIQAR